jgi:hypothetical protein
MTTSSEAYAASSQLQSVARELESRASSFRNKRYAVVQAVKSLGEISVENDWDTAGTQISTLSGKFYEAASQASQYGDQLKREEEERRRQEEERRRQESERAYQQQQQQQKRGK